MRNLFKFVCLLAVFIGSFSFGQDIEALKKDEIFLDYVKNELDMTKNIKSENFEAIGNIIKDKEISEAEEDVVANYLGFTDFKSYSSFVTKQRESLQILNEKYNLIKINVDVLASEVIGSPEVYPIIEPSPQTNGNDCSKSCVRTGRNCRVKAIAVAVVENLGCAAIDSFGIGVACHIASATLLAAELDECDNQQGSCVRGCK